MPHFGKQITLEEQIMATSAMDLKVAVAKALEQARTKFTRQTQALKDTEQLILALEHQLEVMSKKA